MRMHFSVLNDPIWESNKHNAFMDNDSLMKPIHTAETIKHDRYWNEVEMLTLDE